MNKFRFALLLAMSVLLVAGTALAQTPKADNSPQGDWLGIAAHASALVYNTNETFQPGTVRKIVQGPAGQVAIHFPADLLSTFPLRLFSSAQLP